MIEQKETLQVNMNAVQTLSGNINVGAGGSGGISQEYDPTVPQHVKNITQEDIDNWNNNTGGSGGSGASNIAISSNKPINGEDVWFQKSKNLFDSSTIVAGDIKNNTPDIRISSRQKLWLNEGTYTFSTNLAKEYNFCLLINDETYPPAPYYPTFDYNSGWVDGGTKEVTFSTTGGWFQLLLKKGQNETFSVNDIINYEYQLEQGSVATPYEKYVSERIYIKNNNGIYEEFIKKETNEKEMITLQLTADTTQQVSSAWSRHTIPFNKTVSQTGSNLTVTNEGKIIIGKNIKAISVTCALLQTSGFSIIEIASRYTRDGKTTNINTTYGKGTDGAYTTLVNVYPYFSVKEGDIIEVTVTADEKGSVSIQKEGTFFSIEKIL